MILWSFENHKIAPARAINCDFVKIQDLKSKIAHFVRFCDIIAIVSSSAFMLFGQKNPENIDV